MKTSTIVGLFAGLAIGAITGWLSFGTPFSGVGIGISLAAAVCGVLLAYGYEQRK